MRISVTLLFVLALWGCQRNEPVAKEAGKAAYKLTKESEKAAKKMGEEVKKATKEASEGWKDAQHEDKAKHPAKK